MAIDPVCGMDCDEKSTVAKVKHKDKTYSFCSKMCAEEFKKNPEKYL
jgi:YHS domain-containing protein